MRKAHYNHDYSIYVRALPPQQWGMVRPRVEGSPQKLILRWSNMAWVRKRKEKKTSDSVIKKKTSWLGQKLAWYGQNMAWVGRKIVWTGQHFLGWYKMAWIGKNKIIWFGKEKSWWKWPGLVESALMWSKLLKPYVFDEITISFFYNRFYLCLQYIIQSNSIVHSSYCLTLISCQKLFPLRVAKLDRTESRCCN